MSQEEGESKVRGSMPRERPRTRAEIARERAAVAAEIERQIDAIAAEFHLALPRGEARRIGAAYARYSTRFQDSIADQVRGLFEAAVRQGIFLPRENIFYDTATPGYKESRPGLDRLRGLLEAGGIDDFLVFTTNRLFRKNYKALMFVEEQVVARGVRCHFVKSGFDTSDERRWRMLLQVHAMTDELVVGMYAENIRSAHEGLFEAGLVHGTIPFGYRGEVVPGRPTKRGRPRRALAVDPETARWVLKAFEWFGSGLLTIDDISREFNAMEEVPPSPKSLSGRWSHNAVRYLLANPTYRGWLDYGERANVWQVAKDYSRQVPRAEPLRQGQFEHLRIVPDELWHRVQRRLAEQPRPHRPAPRDGDRRSRPLLLNGFFFCRAHGRMLYVGGAGGKSMFCRDCAASREEDRPLYSHLNRATALRRTCAAIAGLVRGDESLAASIVASCRDQAARAQEPDAGRLEDLRRKVARLGERIRFLLGNPGDTDEDRAETHEQLRALRRDRAGLQAELARAEAARNRPVAVPEEAEARALVDDLAALLEAAASSGPEESAREAREAIRLITGGRIELEQMGERRRHGGWLRGRFRARVVGVLAGRHAGVDVDDEGVEVVVDYREPTEAESNSGRVKELCDQGLLIKDVAKRLGISRNLARLARACWYEGRGEPVPDGRSRRKGLDAKATEPPKYARIADEAKRLLDEGLLMVEVRARVGCDPTTLTRAIAHWHESRGLPVPDGRTRRKGLARKVSHPRGRGADGPRPGPRPPAAS